jgi:23S rRNA (uracil1939-C5)-methyltransferase
VKRVCGESSSYAIALLGAGVPRVIAVSCNPMIFARSARIFHDRGYWLAAVTPIDQFCCPAHVQNVSRFERR